jgi:hypothetical protein
MPNMMQFEKNPFPGMNPWLESYWGDIHTSLTTYARDAIQRQLPLGLHARVEEYLSVDEPDSDPKYRHRRISPDIHIAQYEQSAIASGLAGTATIELGDVMQEPIRIRRVFEPETLRYIAIVDKKANRRVITAIEFISPAIKTPSGRRLYVQKQQELIHGDVSLVEIDLLREGEWVIATGEEMYPLDLQKPYRICVTRRETKEESEVYKATYQSPLPSVRIPLRFNEADIRLPLQSLLNAAYENGRYGSEFDYSKPPELALNAEDDAWIQAWLRQQSTVS